MSRFSALVLIVLLSQAVYSSMVVDGSESLVIRAKRADTAQVDGSGEGSGEDVLAHEGSGQIIEASGEGSGSEPVVDTKPAEPALLTEIKEVKPEEEIAKF